MSITSHSFPESKLYRRVYTDPEIIDEFADCIGNFTLGNDVKGDPGEGTGFGIHLTLTYEDGSTLSMAVVTKCFVRADNWSKWYSITDDDYAAFTKLFEHDSSTDATTVPSTPTTTVPATTPSTTAPATGTSHTHSYTSKVTTAATCEKDGVKTFTCSCGDTYTESVKTTGHTWGEWKTVEAASISKEGKAQRTCSACSKTETKPLEKLALPFNDFFNGGNALAVSCLNSGSMNAEGMLNFCSWEIFHSYIYEENLTPVAEKHKLTVAGQDFYFNQYAVPEDVVISIIEKKFVIMEDFWYDVLRSSDRYDSATQTFLCTEPVWFTGFDATIVAYEHMGGNDYTLYLKARIVNHPDGPCSDCATTDSCVLDRPLLSVIVTAHPSYPTLVIHYGTINAVPDSAIPMT